MFAYCGNNPVSHCDPNGQFARSTYDFQQTSAANDGTDLANPKDSPPDHPGFKQPKSGNKKARNPNGKGWGWVDSKGDVWIWDPKMHGGEGWVIQEPGGGHRHAYPGGKMRNHHMEITQPQNQTTSFPVVQQEINVTTFPTAKQESLTTNFPMLHQPAMITVFPQMNLGPTAVLVAGASMYVFFASYLEVVK